MFSIVSEYFTWGPTGWSDELAAGLGVTVRLAILSYLLGIALGLVGAAAAISGPKLIRLTAIGYTVVGRGVPELLIIFLIFYGGNQAIRAVLSLVGIRESVEIGAFGAGVVALGFIVGAAATSIFRGAILSIDKGQLDAARAIGLKPRHQFFLVVLPQAWRVAVPGLSNVWMGLLKETALVSVIGLNDILRTARIAAGSTHDPLPFLLATGVGYLLLTAISLLLLRVLKDRFKTP